MKIIRANFKWLSAIIFIALVPTLARYAFSSEAAPISPHEQARQILELSDVKGGLIVHIGCGDGRLTAALHAHDGYLVHGLDADENTIETARTEIQLQELYGSVSVDHWTETHLPYVDNLVNLVVIDNINGITMDEVMRILAPEGVACLKRDGTWTKKIKPRPEGIDEWTHYLHDASNNAVATDGKIGPPRHLQWTAPPPYSRSHEFNSSIVACVTGGGRIFYILDEGKIGLPDLRFPSRWVLVARDAFNGVLLWKRPIPNWGYREWNTRGLWSTPLTLSRRLVTDGNRVFVTLGHKAPLTILDAATGQSIRTCKGTEGTDEIIYSDGNLVLCTREHLMVASSPDKKEDKRNGIIRNPHEWDLEPPGPAKIMALDPGTGDILWQRPPGPVTVLTLAAKSGRVSYHNIEGIACLDLKSGRLLWWKACPGKNNPFRHDRGTLVMQDEAILYTGEQGVTVFKADTGHLLWSGPPAIGVGARQPADLFVIDSLVWYSECREAVDQTSMSRSGRHLTSGEIISSISVANLISPQHHYRCYRSKATNRFLLFGKRGIEFLDLQGDDHMRNDWVRAPCSYGFIPANGTLYMPPHHCFCYPGVLLTGFNAVVSNRKEPRTQSEEIRLIRGSAYDLIDVDAPAIDHRPSDWPIYRHDIARSGYATSPIPIHFNQAWRTTLGGKLTPPVIADGKLFISKIDAHEVYGLDITSGEPLWTYITGGRVDSSPTYWHGLVLFGSADGYVYCLDASSGDIVWRFRAAPYDQRLVAFGRLESVWPVHGSVVVLDEPARGKGTVYFTAGRSSYLDGGLYLYGLDARTGRIAYRARYESLRPNVHIDAGRPFDMEGARSDILVSDGKHLFLYQDVFDLTLKHIDAPRITTLGDRRVPPHLMATGGFLDDSWWERTYWTYGARWPGFYFASRASKTGQILVFDDERTYGLHVFAQRYRNSPRFDPGRDGYELYADDNDNELYLEDKYRDAEKWVGYTRKTPPVWSKQIPVRARAMVLADPPEGDSGATGRILLLAGPPDVVDPADPYAAFEGRMGAKLWVVSARNGKRLAEYVLSTPPVFDGMAVAGSRLFITLEDGSILCMQ